MLALTLSLTTDADAAAYVAAQQTVDPATKVFVWFVGDRGDVENWTLRWATAGGFVVGVIDITEALFWFGPFGLDADGDSSTTTVVGGFNRSVLKAKNADPARMDRTLCGIHDAHY